MFQLIKQRMKGAQNISQITKAMELVAATKMRRSQEIALRSRPYAYSALDLLRTLAALEKTDHTPPLLAVRPVAHTLILLITSDKGLAGAFNSNVIKKFEQFMRLRDAEVRSSDTKVREERRSPKGSVSCVAVGKKAQAHLEKQGYTVLHAFTRAGDFTSPEEVRPVAELLGTLYAKKEIDQAIAFSTHFRTALAQETLARELLPISVAALTRTINEIVPEKGKYSELRIKNNESRMERPKNLLIEPSPAQVLDAIAAHLLHMELYHLFMEANASEHAARRMAMKNASENAGELVETLTLTYNKLRQAAITKEITEITAGAEALRTN
ncbi:MAG: ATP synthase F1 subunit gamma [Candidatus Liptonbacteria bacterium]|nr:ATP synthase F1 subunit gamma [Candidatus Liptonbacteria bacterium]